MYSACRGDEGPSAAHRSASQYQANSIDADTRPVAERADRVEEGVRGGRQIAVEGGASVGVEALEVRASWRAVAPT